MYCSGVRRTRDILCTNAFTGQNQGRASPYSYSRANTYNCKMCLENKLNAKTTVQDYISSACSALHVWDFDPGTVMLHITDGARVLFFSDEIHVTRGTGSKRRKCSVSLLRFGQVQCYLKVSISGYLKDNLVQ